MQPLSFVSVPGTHVPGPGAFLSQELHLISQGINDNFPKKKDDRFLRLATFNIHLFRDCEYMENHERVYAEIVKPIDPDVIVLQEVPDTLTKELYEPIDKKMASLGFEHVLRCHGEVYQDLGNVMYSKLPFRDTVSRKFSTQNRCFVSGVIEKEWPKGNNDSTSSVKSSKSLRITGSHLDAYRESHRMSEIIEFISFHQEKNQQDHEEKNNDEEKNNHDHEEKDHQEKNNQEKIGHIILADFNAWYSSNVLQYLRSFGFTDSFDAVGWERPNYTCWTGTAIDFILLCPVARDQWEVSGSYVYHSTVSDHLPIVVDIALK